MRLSKCKLLLSVSMLLLCIVMACSSNAKASAILFGVTGDGGSDPETFFSVDTGDASTTVIQTLGNGNDGESIAFNPNDGLMYHWSGSNSIFSTNLPLEQIMETINLTDNTITNIPQDFTSYDPVEVFGSTYDATTGNFLVTDINGNLSSVTPDGVWSTIGAVGNGFFRGIAFNDGDLFVADRFSSTLDNVDPLTGGTISSVDITLTGFTVEGTQSLTTNPDDGVLFAILKTDFSGGVGSRRLATINPLTGVATDIGVLPNGFANIEFQPVPEPSTFALLGLGLGALLIGYRRKMKKS